MNQLTQLLQPSTIYLDIEATEKEEALSFVAHQLLNEGLVRASYPEAVLEREKVFPTGLQTGTCGVAIPHTDPEHVRTEVISLAVLRTPVIFQMMGMNDQQVEVNVIFMLAMKEPHGQLQMLQELTEIFQHPTILPRLQQATSADEVFQILDSQGKDGST